MGAYVRCSRECEEDKRKRRNDSTNKVTEMCFPGTGFAIYTGLTFRALKPIGNDILQTNSKFAPIRMHRPAFVRLSFGTSSLRLR